MELLQKAMIEFQAERQRLEEELQQVEAALGLLSSLPRAKPEHATVKRVRPPER